MTYGLDTMHELLDDAREARLQDQANQEAHDMKPELARATRMLFVAGIKHITVPDAELLAADLLAVAAELAGPEGDPGLRIAEASHELQRRIGGLHNLEPYMATLRAGAQRVRT